MSGSVGKRIRLSRNETESLCFKAARGAGLDWGLAEEAGFAAGWLATRGIDGVSAMEIRLRAIPPSPGIAIAPGHWQASVGATLCPIALGAALVDHALLPDGPFGRHVWVGNTSMPILLLPFLARAAEACRQGVAVVWHSQRLSVGPGGEFDLEAARALEMRDVSGLTICSSREWSGPQPLPGTLPDIHGDVVVALEALALRTTVPATTASRAGAGSAGSDND